MNQRSPSASTVEFFNKIRQKLPFEPSLSNNGMVPTPSAISLIVVRRTGCT
jgi:hypothetical protein